MSLASGIFGGFFRGQLDVGKFLDPCSVGDKRTKRTLLYLGVGTWRTLLYHIMYICTYVEKKNENSKKQKRKAKMQRQNKNKITIIVNIVGGQIATRKYLNGQIATVRYNIGVGKAPPAKI